GISGSSMMKPGPEGRAHALGAFREQPDPGGEDADEHEDAGMEQQPASAPVADGSHDRSVQKPTGRPGQRPWRARLAARPRAGASRTRLGSRSWGGVTSTRSSGPTRPVALPSR